VRGGDVGAASVVDLWEPFGEWFKVGGAMGVAALPSDDAQESRTFLPAGLSLAFVVEPRPVGFDVRVRGGGWAGATNGGLSAGGWVATGGHLQFALDSRIALTLGAEGWFLFGHGNKQYLVPGAGLVWTVPQDDAGQSPGHSGG
jgi:hypothetical protein